ncbi:MAG TPA: hypothetical protein VGF79_14740 [Bacteroidia bacterium]
MKRYIIAFCSLVLSTASQAQSIPVNRLNQLFWGDLIVDQPLYIGDMLMERNKLGKRQLIQDNLLGIGNSVPNRFTNAYLFTNPGLMITPNQGLRMFEFNKTGNGLSGFDFRYMIKRKNSIRLSYVNQNEYSDSRVKGNHLNVFGDFQKSLGYSAKPLLLYFSFLTNYKDQSVGYGLKENEFYQRRTGAIKSPRDLYVNKGLLVSNHVGLMKNFRFNNSRKDIIFNHRNTVALNHTFLNGTRQYIDRQITDISTLRYNLYEGFSKIKLGAEYLYRYTLETDSATVLTNQKLNDWAIFGSIEQNITNASSFTLSLRTDYSQMNGLYVLPNLEYSLKKTKFGFTIKAYRFVNDDISITEYIRPYLQGNRRLSVSSQNIMEQGNVLMSTFNRFIRGTSLTANLALRDYKVKKVLSMNEQFNTLSMNNVRDLEYYAHIQLDSRLLSQRKVGLNTVNSYRFQSFANAQNGLNLAKHSLYNELNLSWGQRYLGPIFGDASTRLAISQTSRSGIDNHFPSQTKNGNEWLICDAKFSYSGYHLYKLLNSIKSKKNSNYYHESYFFNRLRFEFSVYDILSKQVRGNFNQGIQGFSGASIPLMNYRYGVSLVMLL